MISRFPLRPARLFAFASLLILPIFASGCSRLLKNDDPKAMAQWNERYGGNDESSAVLNSMPRDDLARPVELKSLPKRVAVIGPGTIEIIYALGLQSKLVGRDSATDFPIDAKKLPVVGDFNGPNLEQIVAANPDFVIIQGETYGAERIEAWQKQIGVPVANVAATNAQEVAQDAQKIGAWLGQKKTPPLFKSTDLIDENANAANSNSASANSVASQSTKENAPNANANSVAKSSTRTPSALFEIGRQPLWAAGRGTLVSDLLTQGGLRNVAQSVDGYKPFNLETLAAQPPDFYVVTSPNLKNESDMKQKLSAERNRVLESLRGVAGLKNLDCVKRGRVIVLPADWALRPGPRYILAVRALRQQRASFK